MYVGIDVAKDRLDVHVRPTGEAFIVARDGEGLAAEAIEAGRGGDYIARCTQKAAGGRQGGGEKLKLRNKPNSA